MAIWYNFPRFGIVSPVLACSAKKNLATLNATLNWAGRLLKVGKQSPNRQKFAQSGNEAK
jgi:hypothetical protein